MLGLQEQRGMQGGVADDSSGQGDGFFQLDPGDGAIHTKISQVPHGCRAGHSTSNTGQQVLQPVILEVLLSRPARSSFARATD
ncbi:hypothetical protein FUT69_01195 [Xylella taiwanensis]|nr:hypothetical protein [Xylella taiwanensis]